MAFYKVPSALKRSILAFVKNILNKTMTRAIDIVLTPCCDLAGAAEVTCNDDNTYLVVITTTNSIGFLNEGTATVVINGESFDAVVTEPNLITVAEADVTAGTKDLVVTVFLPTNSDDNVGIFKTFDIEDVVFSAC